MVSEKLSAVRSEAENVSLIDPPAPKVDESVNSEAGTRVDGVGAEIASISVASDIDPTVDDTHVVTGTDLGPGRGLDTSDRLLFDFRGFLEGGALDEIFGISPGDTPTPTPGSASGDRGWEVTRLSGGLVNVTVRAHTRRGDCESRRSAIIKYAPPFVAAIGEDAPFGTFRQVIEYRALALLGSTPSITAAEATYGVSIPRVLKFFEDERVLVLQDLGEQTIPLGWWLYPSPDSTVEVSPPSLEMCDSVGRRLGGFLASLHCDVTLISKSQTLTEGGKPWFENPETKDLVRDEIVGKILPVLRPHFCSGTGVEEKIAQIISRDFELSFLDALHPSLSSSSPTGVPKLMFSAGDLWTGSFLIGVSPPSGSTAGSASAVNEVEVGFIDWEFASPARIGQDIAQFSAWIYLFSTSSSWTSTHPRHSHAPVTANIPALSGSITGRGASLGERSIGGTLLNAVFGTYARKVRGYPDYAWFVDEDYDQRRLKKERLAVIRSIWVLFGREVIYNAVEAVARFGGFFEADADGGTEEAMKMWQREMIEVGCWYVSMAGQALDEEFEEIVRKEGLLKKMYTVSGSL